MKKEKRRLKGLLIGTVSLATILSSGLSAGAATFEVGAYWQPPVFVGADYNTNTHWANIAAAKIDMVTAVRVPAGNTLNKAANETGIANSSANNVKLLVTDSSIYGIPTHTTAEISALQALVLPYKNDARVKGINLKDEPLPYELEGYAKAYKAIKATAPNFDVYVNLFPGVAGSNPYPGKMVLSNTGAAGNGSFVTPSNTIGQTITIPAGTTYLDGVVMYMDALQWATTETLTLKLWNSPSKTTLIGQASLAGPGSANAWDHYRYFQLGKAVTAGGTYYLELVHAGGGDSTVGWVIRSNTDVYAGGQAYNNGAAQTYDFNFRLFTNRPNYGSHYENYLDDWLEYSGSDTLLYDHYPFLISSDNGSFFQTMALVRDRALVHNASYGAFLQSIAIAGSYRNTTLNEKRWETYAYLAYGFKNLNWFTYWTPDPAGGETFSNAPVSASGALQAGYSQIQTLNTEMRNLGGTLKDLKSLQVYHTGSSLWAGTKLPPANFFVKPADPTQPTIEGYFTNASGRKYIMLTNRDYLNARTINFNFSPKPASLTEISKSTGLEVAVPGYNTTTGVLNLALTHGEGRLFALPVGYAPTDNLAAEAAVTSTSSYETTLEGWGNSKLTDGQRNSTGSASNGWSSTSNIGANHTESVTINLGSAKTVGEVDIFPRNDAGNVGAGFPIDFTIQVATNSAGPWTTVVTKTGYPTVSDTGQWFGFTPVTAQYVKFQGTNLRQIAGEPGTPYRMQFAEIEVYSSPNYAKGSLMSSTSSVENSEWGLTKARDQIRNSVPGSNGYTSSNSLSINHTESITWNMQSSRSINRVDLFPRNDNGNVGAGFPVNFTVQVASNPAGPWTTVVTQTAHPLPNGLVKSFSFTAATAQYVKLEATSLRQITTEVGAPYRLQLAEVEIH